MKAACLILSILIACSSTFSQQFYLRGEVKDESGNPLQNVTILHLRTGYIYKSGGQGTFGIINTQQSDTFSFSKDGYRPEKMLMKAENYLSIKLKLLPSSSTTARRDKLASLTKDMARDEQRKWFAGDETYASIIENRFVNAKRYPNTGLSLNVDRASYSNIRRFITLNSYVPPDAVRTEEMLNYFNLNYIPPKDNDLFGIKTIVTSCPWNVNNQLFYINLSSKKLNLDTLPASNLVFLIDISGSMDMTNRLPLLKSAFRLLVNNLRAKDSVAIVVYGGITGIMLNTTSGAEKDSIIRAIDELQPGGSTPGESGIKMAYTVAKRHFIKGGNNRVILATDGDFNVGLRTDNDLDELISQQRESGIYLTCLGVGMGNYKDSKIQMLARKGNGNFAYLDNFKEAEKVLLREFTQTLYAVADDAYMNVIFNQDYVKEYRLIGFDNKVGAINDTLSVVEGGEIGSGYSMVGIFEIEPTDKNKLTITSNTIDAAKFADIKLQYKLPNDSIDRYFNYSSTFNYVPFEKLDRCYRFSAAIGLFASMLKSSPNTKDMNWNDMVTLAISSANMDDPLQQEFITIVQQAKTIYTKKKKRGQNKGE